MININDSTTCDAMAEFNQRVGTACQNQDTNGPSKTRAVLSDVAPSSYELALESTDEFSSITERLWAVHSQQRYVPCEAVTSNLPSGQYTINYSNNLGIFFQQKKVNLDELMILPDSASEEIVQQIQLFWTKEKHFRQYGFLWKRGILLWGPPGSGKTSTLQIVSSNIIKNEGISVYVDDPEIAATGLERLRHIEPTRPILVMLEDLDAIVNEHGEASLLALLDGELQIDNVVFIATTNYPERLDKRITNRPSRFDIIKKIEMLSAEARALYLAYKNPRLNENKSELKKWVDATKGFSIAHLKELIVSVEVFNVSFKESIDRLAGMRQAQLESDDGMDHHPVDFYKI